MRCIRPASSGRQARWHPCRPRTPRVERRSPRAGAGVDSLPACVDVPLDGGTAVATFALLRDADLSAAVDFAASPPSDAGFDGAAFVAFCVAFDAAAGGFVGAGAALVEGDALIVAEVAADAPLPDVVVDSVKLKSPATSPAPDVEAFGAAADGVVDAAAPEGVVVATVALDFRVPARAARRPIRSPESAYRTSTFARTRFRSCRVAGHRGIVLGRRLRLARGVGLVLRAILRQPIHELAVVDRRNLDRDVFRQRLLLRLEQHRHDDGHAEGEHDGARPAGAARAAAIRLR